MKQTMQGQHNQHNVLRESARADENSRANEGISTGFAGVDSPHLISAEVIRHNAYGKWEIAGRPTGDGIVFWLEAERELVGEKEGTSGRGNSQDADRHSGIRHPHSLKM